MKHQLVTVLSCALLLLSGMSRAEPPAGAAYLDGQQCKTALILAHGRGKHPTWKVVEPLRTGVHAQLGYHTLSLQMPNADKHWKKYADDFPGAYRTIEEAIRFLREERGVTKIYLMGHSMGSRMASAFIAQHRAQAVAGLIIAGCRNSGDAPLACDENIHQVRIPVLDIWGGGDEKDTDAARDRHTYVSGIYKQEAIPGANHRFDGHEAEFVAAVVAWLKTQESGALITTSQND
mgnify:CR=1 FL=1